MAKGPSAPASTGIQVPSGGSANKKLTTSQSAQLAQMVPGGAEFIASLSGDQGWGPGHRGNRMKPLKAPPGGLSVSGMMQAFLQNLTPAQQAQIQSLMYRAGFYTTAFTPLYGHLKQEDINAFVSAVNLSVAQGQDIGKYLRSSAQAADKSGIRDPSKIQAPKVINLTDPATLNGTLEDAFKSALGRAPNPDEKARFVSTFHAQEAAYGEQKATADQATLAAQLQQKQVAATPESQGLKFVKGQGYVKDPNWVPPTPGSQQTAPSTMTLTNPDSGAQAVATARDQNPAEYNAFQLGQHGQEILNALTSSTPGGYKG